MVIIHAFAAYFANLTVHVCACVCVYVCVLALPQVDLQARPLAPGRYPSGHYC